MAETRSSSSFCRTQGGSAGEVRSVLYGAFDEGYITSDELRSHVELAKLAERLIGGFMAYLKESEFKGRKFKSSDTKGQSVEDCDTGPESDRPR